MAGQLYALAEVRGEIRLVVLDSSTGRLQWSQQLAHVDQQTILIDSLRRMSSEYPSFAEGVLVTPPPRRRSSRSISPSRYCFGGSAT